MRKRVICGTAGSSDCHWCIALALVAKVEQHPVHYGQGVVMRIT